MHKMSKNVLYSCVISMCLIALLISGCTTRDSGKGASVHFEQLLSNPSQYNGKEITIEGFVFLGFETMVLSEELKKSGYSEGHLIPGERMLWIEGAYLQTSTINSMDSKRWGPLRDMVKSWQREHFNMADNTDTSVPISTR